MPTVPNRRQALKHAGALGLMLAAPAGAKAAERKPASGGLLVETRYGRLRGVEEEGVRAFHGVPFAAPPVGSRRFRAPAPLTPWTGVRDAAKSGPASYQANGANLEKINAYAAAFKVKFPGVRLSPPFATGTYAQPVVSEDCLYLDIWAPDPRPGERLPVYVYYHGGANTGSSGSAYLERGAALAREERIIVVRPSYRLGPLGWVHFGLLSDKLGEAVNLGLKDQIAALKWVAANIDHFGGDPGNITVGGESAGGTAVSHLLTNPETRPLFQRAIIQSLSPFNQWCTQKPQDAVAVAELYLQILGVTDVAEIETMDADRLTAASVSLQRYFEADKNCAWRPLGGVVDGVTIPAQPADYLSEATLKSGPRQVMVGFAKDEWQFFRGHSPTMKSGSPDDVIKVLAQLCGPQKAQALFADYQAIYPGRGAPQILSDAMSFEFFKFASLKIAANFARQGIATHVFQFAYDLPGQGGYVKAYHTGDTPFIWRNYSPADLARWPAFEGVDVATLDKSARAFGSMYGAFIRNGNPGPAWPRYEPKSQQVLWFGETVETKPGLLAREAQAFERAGFSSVAALEQRLAGNTRSALNDPARAQAAPRG